MRKSERVSVPTGDTWAGNRDSGKVFLITEMSATRAEKWALRMFIALKGSGSGVSENVAQLGMVGITLAVINAFLRADIDPKVIDELLDEMMTCVQLVRDSNHPEVASTLVSEDDIEEVQTRLWLRSEVLRIHTNFSLAESLWRLIFTVTTPPTSSSIQTSPLQ